MRNARAVLRTVLACALFAGAALLPTGCSPGGRERALVVLGPWTGGEEKPFLAALARIERRTGVPYVYEGTRSLRETLVAQLRTDSPPDVAILNGMGELAEYARDGSAHPLPERLASKAIDPWAPRLALRGVDGEPRQRSYWVPVRVDLKSLVWSRPDANTRRWCLGMASGPTSGWPGTDWIEDLLLQRQGPRVYEEWAGGSLAWTDPRVRRAWRDWRELLLRQGPDTGPAAVSTHFQGKGGRGLLNGGGCAQEHQGSFIQRHYGREVLPYRTAAFVPGLPEREVFEVSGDMAAVFAPSPQAWTLLDELTSARTRAHWARAARPAERPLFPGARRSGGRPTPATEKIMDLFDGAGALCFDASDAMPSTLRGAFQRAVLEFLQAPGDDRLLDLLLRQLDAERELQAEARAFAVERLCGRPQA
ncbi:extracellular solute-binding protein [Streptomyces sp. NPDC000594]|uniref:extracellular solute-binding protein n=1 Tax=Streptomyces sp. NPDC000594 TaxID=3154261 RepID=UPI0033210CDA